MSTLCGLEIGNGFFLFSNGFEKVRTPPNRGFGKTARRNLRYFIDMLVVFFFLFVFIIISYLVVLASMHASRISASMLAPVFYSIGKSASESASTLALIPKYIVFSEISLALFPTGYIKSASIGNPFPRWST